MLKLVSTSIYTHSPLPPPPGGQPPFHPSSWRRTSTPPPGGQTPLLLLAVNLHSSSWRTTLNPSWQSTSTTHDSLGNRAKKYPVCVPSERNIRSWWVSDDFVLSLVNLSFHEMCHLVFAKHSKYYLYLVFTFELPANWEKFTPFLVQLCNVRISKIYYTFRFICVLGVLEIP